MMRSAILVGTVAVGRAAAIVVVAVGVISCRSGPRSVELEGAEPCGVTFGLRVALTAGGGGGVGEKEPGFGQPLQHTP